MTNNQRITQAQLESYLWRTATLLRGLIAVDRTAIERLSQLCQVY